MKKPFIIAIALILGIILSNVILGNKKEVTNQVIEDSIETSQAANIPL
jgi:hypothetical protein